MQDDLFVKTMFLDCEMVWKVVLLIFFFEKEFTNLKGRVKIQLFHMLIYSPVEYNGQSWARNPEPETPSRSLTWAQAHSLGLSYAAFPWSIAGNGIRNRIVRT